jgi:hypothetical protein
LYSPKYAPHEGQKQIHESTKRLIFVHAGSRFGKDRWGVNEVIHRVTEMLDEPRPDHLIPRVHAWIVAPTIGLCKQLWRELLFFMPRAYVKRIDEHEMTMWTVKGGVLEVKSATKNLFSTGLDIVYWSELSRMNESTIEPVFSEAYTRLLSPGRGPNGSGGICLVSGTPRKPTVLPDGRIQKGFFQRLREAVRNNPEWDVFHFTTTDNPYVPKDAEEKARGYLDVDAFKCEWLGEFIDYDPKTLSVHRPSVMNLARVLGKSTPEGTREFCDAFEAAVKDEYANMGKP